MKPLNEYSFSEFRSAIKNAVKDPENWYFSQSTTAYFADYRPNYPDKTAADFTVVVNFSSLRPRITLYQDAALLPTINQFATMPAFIDALRES